MAAGELADWQQNLSHSLLSQSWPDSFAGIIEKLSNNIPLSRDDGNFLFTSKELDVIGQIANLVKQARFGNHVFFNMNVHINQTNICTLACKFCAFRRGRRAADAYQMEISEYIEDLRTYSSHVDEVHSVGGLHPDWDAEYYCELFSQVKEEFPHIHIKALTAVEIKHIAGLSNCRSKDTGQLAGLAELAVAAQAEFGKRSPTRAIPMTTDATLQTWISGLMKLRNMALQAV